MRRGLPGSANRMCLGYKINSKRGRFSVMSTWVKEDKREMIIQAMRRLLGVPLSLQHGSHTDSKWPADGHALTEGLNCFNVSFFLKDGLLVFNLL